MGMQELVDACRLQAEASESTANQMLVQGSNDTDEWGTGGTSKRMICGPED